MQERVEEFPLEWMLHLNVVVGSIYGLQLWQRVGLEVRISYYIFPLGSIRGCVTFMEAEY